MRVAMACTRQLLKPNTMVWGAVYLLGLLWSLASLLNTGRFGDAVLLAGLWGLTNILGIRLGRGDMVFIDVSLGLAALVLFPLQVVMAGFAVGGAIGILVKTRHNEPLQAGLSHIGRRVLLLTAVSPLALAAMPESPAGFSSIVVQARLVGFGLVYAAGDLATAAAVQCLHEKRNFADELHRLARPIAVVYLGHISTGVVVVLLYGAMGNVGLVAMVTLALMMQNSFNLLLRIRTAYQETIQALTLASEIQVPGEKGHARRVARIAAAAGRRLGLRGKGLERLSYAALLHDIGKIGAEESDTPTLESDHARIGADIVGQIPFVQAVAGTVRHHEDAVDSLQASGDALAITTALIVKASSRLDRLMLRNPAAHPREVVASAAFDDMRSSTLGLRILSAIEATVPEYIAEYRDLGGTES